jgi:hypothetical protein
MSEEKIIKIIEINSPYIPRLLAVRQLAPSKVYREMTKLVKTVDRNIMVGTTRSGNCMNCEIHICTPLVEETGEKHGPVASHWKTLSHNAVSRTPHREWDSNSQLYNGFSGVRDAQSLFTCVLFCRLLFGFLSFFFWPLYCMPFLDLQHLIIPFLKLL